MRSVPLDKCYIMEDLAETSGLCHIVVSRRHTGGRVSAALFMVDMFCLGVTESFYRLRIEEDELQDLLNAREGILDFRECTYEEAHNRIYGAVAFAEEAGIKPDRSFLLTQYMLEEDTDDVPLLEFEYGKQGRHFLVCDTHLEASRYLPTLRKALGEDGFDYLIVDDDGESNISDDNDEKPYVIPSGPLRVADIVKRISRDDVLDFADVLHITLDERLDTPRLRQAYAKAIMADPLEVLSHFCLMDFNLLRELRGHPEFGMELPYHADIYAPLMACYGMADAGRNGKRQYVVRVADDFWQAVKDHLEEVAEDPAVQIRQTVEVAVEGLANLYGEVSRKTIIDLLKKSILKKQAEVADEVFDMAWERSMLLDWMVQPLYDYNKSTDRVPADKLMFASRYGWEDNEALRKETARRSRHILHPKPFTDDDIIMATNDGVPVMPNKQRKEFVKFLKKKLDIPEQVPIFICFSLWLCAQHEDDPDDTGETCESYFEDVVLSNENFHYSDELKAEAREQLHDFLDHMPRWTLKGYAPCEV